MEEEQRKGGREGRTSAKGPLSTEYKGRQAMDGSWTSLLTLLEVCQLLRHRKDERRRGEVERRGRPGQAGEERRPHNSPVLSPLLTR